MTTSPISSHTLGSDDEAGTKRIITTVHTSIAIHMYLLTVQYNYDMYLNKSAMLQEQQQGVKAAASCLQFVLPIFDEDFYILDCDGDLDSLVHK